MSVLLIFLAAFFKAVADTCDHHFDTSVFRKLSRNFWDNSDAWHTHPDRIPPKRLPFTKYPVDGWHLSNTGMITCFLLSATLHDNYYPWYYEIFIGGALFNGTFNVFYNHILRRKT